MKFPARCSSEAKVDVSYEERERGSEESFKHPLYIPPWREVRRNTQLHRSCLSCTTQRSIEDDSIGEIPANARIVARQTIPRRGARSSSWKMAGQRRLLIFRRGASHSRNETSDSFLPGRPGRSSFAGGMAPPLKRILLACPARQRPLLPRRHSPDTRRFLGFCA